MTDELTNRILSLDRAAAFEAAQLLAADLGADIDDAQPPDDPILSDPLGHQDDIEDLSRILLAAAAEVDADAVSRALDGAGRRQFVLGGLELVVLGTIALEGLRIVLTRGATSEEKTVTVERAPDGSERGITATKRTFGISKGLANLLRGAIA
jgi:hypothetical protein